MDFRKPRAARDATSGTRSPIVRTLWTAVAGVLIAVLLPAAISLASTGTVGAYSVIDAIGAAKPKPENQQQDASSGPPSAIADTAADAPPLAVLSDTSTVVPNRSSDEQSRPVRDDRTKPERARRNGDARRDRVTDEAVGKRRAYADQSREQASSTTPTSDTAQVDAAASPSASDDNSQRGERAPTRTPANTVASAPVKAPTVVTAPDSGGTDATTAPPAADDVIAKTGDDVPSLNGRRQFALASGESVSLVVDMSTDTDSLTFWAKGSGSECPPRLAVLVDRHLDEVLEIGGADWQAHAIDPTPHSGLHTVRLIAIGHDANTDCATDESETIAVLEPKPGDEGKVEPTADATGVDAAAETSTSADDTNADGSSTTATTALSTDSTNSSDVIDDSATAADDRRQVTLYRDEDVRLNLDVAADDEPVTLWARAARATCVSRVEISVDRRVVDTVEISGTDWLDHTLDGLEAGRHSVQMSFVRTDGQGKCPSDAHDWVTLVEPTTGDAAAQTPPQPVVGAPADDSTTTSPDGTSETTTASPDGTSETTTTSPDGTSETTTPSPDESAGTANGAPTGTGELPSGLTVAIVPKVGRSPLDYFARVNGTPPPGRKAYISDDLGIPAIRMDAAASDPPSPGDYDPSIRRNQIIDPKKVDGGVYSLTDGATAYNGVRVKYGPKTQIDPSSFVSNFNWVSFIGGQGSGPFGLMQDGRFSGRSGMRFSTAFGISNPVYGSPGHDDYADLPFPDRWMDVLVGVHYSKSWTDGWLELSWKWASEPVSAFRAMKFPAPGAPTRYITRTLGDTMNTVNTGIYTTKPMDMQWGLGGFFVASDRAKVVSAFGALGSAG
jgi:hypothetical protein